MFRLLYAMTAVVALFLTEAGRFIYRPYIYRNDINDFGIADSMGNLGGITGLLFFSVDLQNSQKKKAFNVIGFLVAGYILYEIIQPYLPKGVFDWKDVYGTIIGGCIAAMILVLLRQMVKTNRVLIRF